MVQSKGIVMRTLNNITVVYTEKGDFLEIPTPKELPLIGQTIEVNLKPGSLPLFKSLAFKYTTAAAVLLLVLSVSALLYIPNMAVASVALDINKGIELLINREGKVIKVQDVNGGSTILEGLSVKDTDIYQAVYLVLENAQNKGTFNKTQNLVFVRVVALNGRGNQIVNIAKLQNTIRDELLRINVSGIVVVGKAGADIQREARKHGMTVNSYLIYERAQQQGIGIQPDTLRNDVQKALDDAKASVSSLFPEENFEVAQHQQGEESISEKASSEGPTVGPGQPSNLESNLSGGTSGSSQESAPSGSSSIIDQLQKTSPNVEPQNNSGIPSDTNIPGSIWQRINPLNSNLLNYLP